MITCYLFPNYVLVLTKHALCTVELLLCIFFNQVNQSGTSMQMRTTDNVEITVQLPQDTMDMPQGLVELRGTVINGNSLNCDDLIKFETDPHDFG
jgi:hypothetical protein